MKRQDDLPHPTQDDTDRFTTDQRLRSFGYRIHSRPKRGEPVWELGGQRVPQSTALDLIGLAIAGVAT